jgi:hypothetical protein
MPDHTLLFWKPRSDLRLSPEEVARELIWGEEVAGLIDLPIKEVIERLKAAFPDHQEQPGHFVGRTAEGTFEATWTWQHVRAECRGLSADERQRLTEVLTGFGCVMLERET